MVDILTKTDGFERIVAELETSLNPDQLDRLFLKLDYLFTTPNEADSNFEVPNMVDGLYAISRGLHHIARAIENVSKESTEV